MRVLHAGGGGGAPHDPHSVWSVALYNSCKVRALIRECIFVFVCVPACAGAGLASTEARAQGCPPPEKLIARMSTATEEGNVAWLTMHMPAAKVRACWGAGGEGAGAGAGEWLCADVDPVDGVRAVWCG